jgi:Flp pilus assembly protein TadG
MRRFRSDEGGQAVLLVAITFTALLMTVGLAIDTGQLFSARRTAQEAADAAAYAAAVVIYEGGTSGPSGSAVAAAIADATLNGYTTGSSVTVSVNSPPTGGSFVGNTKFVEVLITAQVQTRLAPGANTFTKVSVRSVAGAAPEASPYAIVLLKAVGPCMDSQNGSTGNLIVDTTSPYGGQIQANCSGTSIDLQGSGTITDSLGVRTVGSVSNPARVVGPLTQSASSQPDPFAGYPKPAATPIISAGSFSTSACATVLQPGVYGSIYNNLSPACDIQMATGVYIIKGDFNNDAQSGKFKAVAGGGVMIFMTHSNYPGPIGAGTCGTITAQQGGGFDIQSMTTAQNATYAGMAYFQDPACTNAITISSNGAYNFHGTLYAPSAPVSVESQSALTVDAQIVCSEMHLTSNGNLTVRYNPSASAQSGLPELAE